MEGKAAGFLPAALGCVPVGQWNPLKSRTAVMVWSNAGEMTNAIRPPCRKTLRATTTTQVIDMPQRIVSLSAAECTRTDGQ